MKRILLGMGVAFMVLIGAAVLGIGYVGTHAYMAASDNKQAAVIAIKQISTNWSFKGRYEIVDARLIQNGRKPQVARFLRRMRPLGTLVQANNIVQVDYGMSTSKGTTATIKFNGIFTNGTAIVTAELRKTDGKMKLIRINISNGRLNQRSKQNTA